MAVQSAILATAWLLVEFQMIYSYRVPVECTYAVMQALFWHMHSVAHHTSMIKVLCTLHACVRSVKHVHNVHASVVARYAFAIACMEMSVL